MVGSSHGGNACGLVMATHGDEFADLAFYASMESPYGEGNVNIELGGRDQGVNPAYDPETGQLNLSKLAWSADLPPGPPRRWQGEGAGLKGALFFDLNGDGRFSPSDDYPANAFVQDLGQGPKAWYTPRLIRQAEKRKLYGQQRPAHVPSLAESIEYWRWRDAAESIAAAVSKCPQVAVIVYANERDHVQVAPDHPHILAQVEGFREAGAKFVRLNPDRAYVERILASGGPPLRQRPRTFPDNEAGTAWNRGNIRSGLEPADLPMQPYMQAAVCELADRAEAQNWAKNLDAVLYPDAPWTALGTPPRQPGAKPALPPLLRKPAPGGDRGLPQKPGQAAAAAGKTAGEAKGPRRLPEDRILIPPTETTRIASLNGKRILVRTWKPKGDGPFPALIGCPGGIGGATWNAEMPVQGMLDLGIALIDFAPQGRTGSEGEEDEGGPTHQDDLRAVIAYARTLPFVDLKQVAVLTRSFGVTMGMGCLARHPELKVLFLIDIEGPSAIRKPTWTELTGKQRRALTFVGDLAVPYLRIQCDVDHAQGESKRHMADLVNGAIKGGKCPWVRVNDNPPNLLYTEATAGKFRWEKGVWTRNPETNEAILRHIKDMFFQRPWAKAAAKNSTSD
jgi:hypothetical protein